MSAPQLEIHKLYVQLQASCSLDSFIGETYDVNELQLTFSSAGPYFKQDDVFTENCSLIRMHVPDCCLKLKYLPVSNTLSEGDIIDELRVIHTTPKKVFLSREASGKSLYNAYIVYDSVEDVVVSLTERPKPFGTASWISSTKQQVIDAVGCFVYNREDSVSSTVLRIHGIPFHYTPRDVHKHFEHFKRIIPVRMRD